MANVLEYLTIIQKELDVQTMQGLTSAWTEANQNMVEYNGGKKVKFPSISTGGLGDYGRTDGTTSGAYPKNSVTTTMQEEEMTQDRASEFIFDRHDFDETGMIVNTANTMKVFQQEAVIPEIDSYRYSKMAQKAIELGKNVDRAITIDNIVQSINSDILQVKNSSGITDSLSFKLTISYSMYELLTNAKYEKGVTSLTDRNGIDLEYETFNKVPMVVVPDARMKSLYVFDANNGFTADPTAQDINWIICTNTLPIAVSKTDQLKYFSPDVNQDGDDHLIKYRKYHDLWIKNQKAMTELVVCLNKPSGV